MKALKNKAEFDFVYKYSRKYYGECFHSYILTFSHPSFRDKSFSFRERKIYSTLLDRRDFCIGLSVSKKVGNAPMRNKIKRWFRAFCRLYQGILQNKAIIFVAKKNEGLSYQSIEKEMLKILNNRTSSPKQVKS